MKWFSLFLVPISLCFYFVAPDSEQQESTVAYGNMLSNTFEHPSCNNPCWRGIEVGVTDKDMVIEILEDNSIEYTLEGYNDNSIWLRYIPNGLFPDLSPNEFTTGGIQIDSDGKVILINFEVNLCVSTIISVYGEPKTWHDILVYPHEKLFFGLNSMSTRIDAVYLHLPETMPPPEELGEWADYESSFLEKCSDIFAEYHGET